MKNLMFAFVLMLAFASCESPSGRAHRAAMVVKTPQPEKVVIIEVKYHNIYNGIDTYKVHRVSQGVVRFIELKDEPAVYAIGDTILYKF